MLGWERKGNLGIKTIQAREDSSAKDRVIVTMIEKFVCGR
jgi:hypothetical protein